MTERKSRISTIIGYIPEFLQYYQNGFNLLQQDAPFMSKRPVPLSINPEAKSSEVVITGSLNEASSDTDIKG